MICTVDLRVIAHFAAGTQLHFQLLKSDLSMISTTLHSRSRTLDYVKLTKNEKKLDNIGLLFSIWIMKWLKRRKNANNLWISCLCIIKCYILLYYLLLMHSTFIKS